MPSNFQFVRIFITTYPLVWNLARAQKYYSSIEWLLRADIIHLSKKVALIMGLQR